jgi:hypothetical protein
MTATPSQIAIPRHSMRETGEDDAVITKISSRIYGVVGSGFGGTVVTDNGLHCSPQRSGRFTVSA